MVDSEIFKVIMLVVLPLTACYVLRRRDLGGDRTPFSTSKTSMIASTLALLIGIYDGFYGPGTGTFLIIAFTTLAKFPLARANAHAKIINLTTNLTSLAVFLTGGQVVFALGLAGAVCNMAGNFLGAELALKRGAKITKPVILVVLSLLALKILGII